MPEEIEMTTMCVVWDKKNDRVVMLNRQHSNWRGYTPPGGHVDFPESLTDCAIREVKEETGLTVWGLTYKGLTHFVDGDKKDRYMVFNYITENYSGELLVDSCEGRPEWVNLSDIDKYQLAPGIKERLQLFFGEGVSEMHIIWDDSGRRDAKVIHV